MTKRISCSTLGTRLAKTYDPPAAAQRPDRPAAAHQHPCLGRRRPVSDTIPQLAATRFATCSPPPLRAAKCGHRPCSRVSGLGRALNEIATEATEFDIEPDQLGR